MKITKTLIGVALCAMLSVFTAFSVNGEEIEYVVFGSYPKSEVVQTQELKNADYDENGNTVIDGSKYRRVKFDNGFRYFLYEPIIWQRDGNTLVAVDVLDSKMYDEQEEKTVNFGGGIKYADSVTWEECSLRAWLNGEFAACAFSESERMRLSGEVRLMSVAEATAKDKSLLCKNATEYAVCAGIEPKSNDYSSGNSNWLLMDVSPVTSSAVCTVSNSGTVNTGMTVLVNEPGFGVVPCITLTDLSGIYSYTEEAPEKTVEMYYLGGRTALFGESQVSAAIAEGWYADKNDAVNESALSMKVRFESSALNSVYDWRLYNAKSPYISIDAPKKDMTPAEAIDFIKPIVDTFYTGNMEDYMEVHIQFTYSKQAAASLSEFSDTVGKSIHDAVEACWSGWGNIVCSDGGMGRLNGTHGAGYCTTIRFKINADGNYSLEKTNYNNTLHTLAEEARNYSSRPLGQLQYLRHYFGQNTVYEGSLFTNEPSTLITTGEGVCGSYANFTADFCRLLGIPCVVYTNDKAVHAWNGVYVEGKWYHMDHTGVSDKESMREYYSNYNANNEIYSFNPEGFPDEHTAENVNFLMDSYYPIDNLSEADLSYVHSLFASDDAIAAVPPAGGTEEKEITVLLNGEKLDFDVAPVIENGRTLVPMRKIFESLGATVYWNGDTLTATGLRDVTVVTITVDSVVMTKNGKNILLDVPARLINSRTLVPVRVIAESFGLNVSWDEAGRTVTIE